MGRLSENVLRRTIWGKTFFLALFFSFMSCKGISGNAGNNGTHSDNSKDLLFVDTFFVTTDKEIIIKKKVDLGGKLFRLTKNVNLVFEGGCFSNGSIEGFNNKIRNCTGKPVFDNIKIKGEWRVDTIKTSLFANLSDVNSLKDVFALCNPRISNVVEIEPGNYILSVSKNGEACLPVSDNTELILNGKLKLLPNEFPNYQIIRANGANIIIRGNGSIRGEADEHLKATGEWGMGIMVSRGHNVEIRDLKISNCWGDCIYIGDKSKNIIIEGCILKKSRRQGISITSADSVTIRKCQIDNIGGTSPGYAIDVEPNRGDSVNNVQIEQVRSNDCMGTFLVNGYAEEAFVGNVTINNATAISDKKISVRVMKCDNIRVTNCNIYCSNPNEQVVFQDVREVVTKQNEFGFIEQTDRRNVDKIKNGARVKTKPQFKNCIIFRDE